MRIAILVWLGALALAIGSLANCSITHRSDEFACPDNVCAQGRTCVDGYCVVTEPLDAGGSGGKPDAKGSGSNQPDAGDACPAQCTSCDQSSHTCTVECKTGAVNCNAQINCPSGWNCTINCDVQNACRAGVNCTDAASCAITCSGQSACRSLSCGDGPCDVSCTGAESCRTVGCNNSCRCDVTCAQGASCTGIICSQDICEDISGGHQACSSQNPTCDTCQ